MSSSGLTPRVFAHSSRPDWGRAVIAEELTDRTTYVFETGGERTLMNAPSRLHEVELPAAEREALAKALLKNRGPARLRAVAKAADELTFEQQEAAFTERFPEGFAGAKYVRDSRGAADDGRGVDALIACARELFAKDRLDAAIARGAFAEVHADATKIVAIASKRFAFAKLDTALLEKLPATGHEKLARALRDLLHGDAAYATRFNAFVKSIAPKGVPWTVATVFAAAMFPEAHVLVKAAPSRRQARVLGVAEPSNGGGPSGAAYAKHLTVAEALRERLIATGRSPRDLFDVYTYSWRTLAKSAKGSSRS